MRIMTKNVGRKISLLKKVNLSAPKATPEQLNLARLLHTNSDNIDYQRKLQQIQECAACDLEKAVTVLHDANNNVQRAIECILDHEYENDWEDTITKKSKARNFTDKGSKFSNLILDCPKVSFVSSKTDQNTPSDRRVELSSKTSNTRNSIGEVKNKRGFSNEAGTFKNASLPETIHAESWDIKCREWKGEAIEVINSANIPKNIHDDQDLLKPVTWEPEKSESDKCSSDNLTLKAELVKNIQKSNEKDDAEITSNRQAEDQVQIIKNRLFKKYARTSMPTSCFVPDVPVFFAPGARNTLISEISAPHLVPVLNDVLKFEQSLGSLTRVDEHDKLAKPDQVPLKNLEIIQQLADSQDRRKSSTYSPAINTLLQSVGSVHQSLQAKQLYSTPLHNTSVHKETCTNIPDHRLAQNRVQTQPLNDFEPPKSYNYSLLSGSPQNMKPVSLEMLVAKSQPLQVSKPACAISNADLQALPTTQPQLHPVLHPSFPQHLSHLQPNVSMFNFPGGSGPVPAPHLLDMDQFQILQLQQRMLFEMQQRQYQSQHSPQHAQAVSNDNNLSTTTSDVISSTNSSLPMHQANVGSSIAFLPYPGPMVLMNGYPNAYLGQQQTLQTGGPRNRSTSTTLSHPSSHQYPKAIDAVTNYTGYQGPRQPTFEEFNDALYPNLAKQMAYKHSPSGVQEFYNHLQQSLTSGVGPDLSLGDNFQQPVAGLSPAQQTQTPNPAPGVQPQAMYSHLAPNQYAMYPQYVAMAAAAAAAQNQQQSRDVPSSVVPGSGGMVSMHSQSTH